MLEYYPRDAITAVLSAEKTFKGRARSLAMSLVDSLDTISYYNSS